MTPSKVIAFRVRPSAARFGSLSGDVIEMKGETFHTWRAVDQHGDVLYIHVQKQRKWRVAERFLKKLVATYDHNPRILVTDKLRTNNAT